MEQDRTQEKQPWVTCYLTDILISYIKETKGSHVIDWPTLFRGVEGLETPADPEPFLTDVNNWVPLPVLRELEIQCEKITAKKDVAYHAAKAYFSPGKRPLPSLFEIIVQVLNDVRSALISANLWGAAQTNYLKLQSFERPGATPKLYVLAQFDENAGPAVGAVHFLRGFLEGFPRLYPFIDEARVTEEISQLRIETVAREFPDFLVTSQGSRLLIGHRSGQKPIVEATKIRLQSETIPL